MTEEQWRDVVGFEGYYQVSSFGRVRSIDREIISGRGRPRRIVKGQILKPSKTVDGYRFCSLSYKGKHTNAYVHRMLGEAFIPNPDNKPVINHINANREDNRSS